MLSKIGSKILSICSWIFGIMFALVGFVAIFQEGFFIGLLMFVGAILLLPPTKRRLIAKTSKLSKGRLSAMGSFAIILAAFGFSEPEPVPDSNNTPQMLVSESKQQKNVANQTETDIEEKRLVEVEDINQDQNADRVDNPFTDTEELTANSTDKVEIEETKPVVEKPKPVPVVEKPKPVANNSCSGLPRTCGKMSSCKQAYQALECGNRRLDKDKDGIPCESICQ